MIVEFYFTYVADLVNLRNKGELAKGQPQVNSDQVQGKQVDILDHTIQNFLFGPEYKALFSTKDYDYRLVSFIYKRSQMDVDKRKRNIIWIPSMIQKYTNLVEG